MASATVGCHDPRQKRPRRRAEEHSPFERLPPEIVCEIVSRLPLVTIARARAVCKQWDSTLKQCPEFQETSSCRYLFADPRKSTIYIVEDAGGGIHDVSKIGTSGRDGCHHVVASSGGLICHHSMKTQNEPLYICNPVLGEHVELPAFGRPSSSCSEYLAFGYDPAGEYCKLVRLTCFCYKSIWSSHNFTAEIHTLGTNSWRTMGPIPEVPIGNGVHCRGSIHWKTRTGVSPPPLRETVLSLDLGTEEFGVEAGPKVDIKVGDTRYIVALGEDLCFVVSSRTRIWVWVRVEAGAWCKRYTLDTERWWGSMKGPRFEVVGRSKDGALLGLTGNGLGFYDPRNQTLKRMELPPEVEGIYTVYTLTGESMIAPTKFCRWSFNIHA